MGNSTTLNLLAEFSFTTTNVGPITSQGITMSLENDLWKGTEGTPLTLPNPEEWLLAQNVEMKANKGQPNGYAPLDAGGKVPAPNLPGGILIDPSITTLAGTASASLAAIASTALPLDRVLGIVIDGTLSFYQLKSGTSDTAAPGIIRPNDYHATTNARFWKQIL